MWINPLYEEPEVCPEAKLAASILALAIEDALGNCRKPSVGEQIVNLQARAQRWIADDSETFSLWCAVAGTTPEAIRRHLAYRLAEGRKVERKRAGKWMSLKEAAKRDYDLDREFAAIAR